MTRSSHSPLSQRVEPRKHTDVGKTWKGFTLHIVPLFRLHTQTQTHTTTHTHTHTHTCTNNQTRSVPFDCTLTLVLQCCSCLFKVAETAPPAPLRLQYITAFLNCYQWPEGYRKDGVPSVSGKGGEGGLWWVISN